MNTIVSQDTFQSGKMLKLEPKQIIIFISNYAADYFLDKLINCLAYKM